MDIISNSVKLWCVIFSIYYVFIYIIWHAIHFVEHKHLGYSLVSDCLFLQRSDVSLMSVLCRWTERSIGRTWAQVEEANRRELLLQAFRRRCSENRQTLTQDVLKISRHSNTLEQLARSGHNEIRQETLQLITLQFKSVQETSSWN